MSRIARKTAQLSPCPDGFALEHQLLLPDVPVCLVVGLELGLQVLSDRVAQPSHLFGADLCQDGGDDGVCITADVDRTWTAGGV